MGITLKEQGRLEEALEAHGTTKLKPDYPEAPNNIVRFKEQGRLKKH